MNGARRPARVYLASSWRNPGQPAALHILRRCGLEVYDFRNPAPGQKGFAWSDIDPDWKSWSPDELIAALEHERAREGYGLDWDAMRWADAGVLLMPCGRSAHLEAGYFVGAGKPLHVILSDGEPELMYRMAYETGGKLHGGNLSDAIFDAAIALGGKVPEE